MSKILITGGLGFIGHNVVKLLQDEHQVTVYDSLTNYGILNQTELDWLMKKREIGITGPVFTEDIRDRVKLARVWAVANPDVVIHLASFPRAKVVNSDPVMGSDVMMTALMSMLTLAKESRTKRFVYVSSSMVYGDFQSGTTEFATCNPQGSYAIFKYAGELLVKDFCKKNGMDYTIVRPSAVYGPLDVEDRVVSKFLINAMRGQPLKINGAGEVLDFTYVSDIAQGLSLAATSENAANETFNVTRGAGHTLMRAALLAISVTNSSSQLIMSDKDALFPSRGSLDVGKAKLLLNYEPKVDIEEGFKLYADWLYNDSIYWTR